MRVLLLRISTLTAMVVLGCIAIANAQRDSDEDNVGQAESQPYDGNVLRGGAASSANPLRPGAPANPLAGTPVGGRPAADPFGLQARRDSGSTVPPPSPLRGDNSIPDAAAIGLAPPRDNAVMPLRSTQAAMPASAEQPATGPALTPAVPNRYAGNRNAAGADRSASQTGGRYAAPPAADSKEPAPLKIDPFAMPASPKRPASAGHGAVGTAAQLPPAQPAQLPVLQSADGNRAATPAAEDEGTGQPGDKQFDGVQSPQLAIQKLAPKEIQVGRPASFRVAVRNVGSAPACDVEVRDLVPKGTRLLGTTGQASRGPHGEITWALGTIRPGEESAVEMQVMPIAEGEIGSVATVHFRTDASARTIATRPQLVVEASGRQQVLIGEQAMLTITVSNPGTGVATGVVLEERVPPGLQHPAGTELEYEVGDLRPGESRKLELPLLAQRPGPAANVLRVRGDANLRAEHKFDLEVLAPQLDVALDGPKRRYLERQATYTLSVNNPGTASARQVELVANLPAGLKFVSANNAGYYEEASRTVRWRLEELPANETGSVELVTMPVEAGRHAIRLRGTAQKGLAVEKEQPVIVEGIAAIVFQVADTVDPIEIGGETTYEVRVANQGSKAAANLRLAIVLPPELQPVAAEGPTRHALDGDRVLFDSLVQLAPKGESAYRLRVKALKPGDLRTRFQLLTDDMQTPVTKEESTRVYADE